MTILCLATGLLFMGIALPLLRRRVKPNHLYGLRTPETLADEAVWYEANARSARDLLALGALVTACALPLFVVEGPYRQVVLVVWVLVVTLGTLLYAVRGLAIARRVQKELEG
ncbi:MAG TPA: SdpI family protein [Candidatus Krumholzibacteria bacterium]|nr:SdpI family protein [Candidatus Krumholzibacteria bacterium]HRX52024.1 SdpI family protein [Candidatus Krumholzibacteria bacterium]